MLTNAARIDDDFYARLPVFDGFRAVIDPQRYTPLPDDWLLGLTDVTGSTSAIAGGGYKAVNTAGASAIAAVTNALGGRSFPFVFGGDGASLAVSAADESSVRAALAATTAWTRDELGLVLRAALIPVAEVREQGLDVRVARFAPSPDICYAMFSGGGMAWADRALKAGRYAVAPAEPGVRPDLGGLSCRWNDIPASKGAMLSLVIAPVQPDSPAFRDFVGRLLDLLEHSSEVARPVPDGAPGVRWPPAGVELEARASRRSGEGRLVARLRVLVLTLFSFVLLRFGIRAGAFDPAVYRRTVAENSDFRKFDDVLRMTLDCTPSLADRIEARLAEAAAAGIVRFGVHRQAAAIMTCIVPSPIRNDHFHFVDGAGGGYAMAAQRMKDADAIAR